MNKIQFDKLLKPLVEIYDEIELDLIRNILARLDNYRSVEGSLEWYLEKLSEQNTLNKENLEVFKKNKKAIKKVLRKILINANRTKDYDKLLNKFEEKGLINKNTELYNSPTINNLIDNALIDCVDIVNLIDSKALESTNEVYKKIINKAYIETASGVYTYTESIRRALNDMAEQGIDVVHYESGRKLGIESVVRRDVVTRVNKLVGETTIENVKDLGTNLVYVDEHLGARVRTKYMKHDYEAHVEWQGEVYQIDAYDETKYPNGSSEYTKDFYKYTGFGEMLGLKGINCYHNFRPFFRWEEKPEHKIEEVENAKQYELLQQQRAFERKIRKYKRLKLVNKDNDKEKYNLYSNRLKSTNKEFDNFLNANGLRRDYNREYVSNK